MPPDLSTTNLWLGVLATVAVLELAALVVAGVFAYRAWRRVEAAIDRIDEQRIAPLTARAHEVLDDVQQKLASVDSTVDAVRTSVRSRFWPVIGLARAVSASVERMRTPGTTGGAAGPT